MEIRELTSNVEWRASLGAFQSLYSALTEESLIDALERITPTGYKLFGLFEDDIVVSVAGVQPIDLLTVGRVLWLFDMATRRDVQRKRYGAKLLSFVQNYASKNGYTRVLLHTAMKRDGAIKFYQKEIGEPFGYMYRIVTKAV